MARINFRNFHVGARKRFYPLTALVLLSLLLGGLPAAREYFSNPGAAQGHGQHIKAR